jgi:hypothetical protein
VLCREIALMMVAVSTSETYANFYETSRCNIPEDSHLQGSCLSYNGKMSKGHTQGIGSFAEEGSSDSI